MSALKTAKTVTLASPDSSFVALIQPAGAALGQLSLNGEVIAGTPTGQANYGFAGAVMAPWANRLADGRYQFGGATFQNPIDEPAYQTALHGLVFNREFEIVQQTNNEVEFEIKLGKDSGYPFESVLRVWYELTDFGLISGLEFTNLGNQQIPLTTGFHPYFAFDDGDAVSIGAERVVISNSRLLPEANLKSEELVGKQNAVELDLATLNLDNCFENLIVEENGWHYSTILRNAKGWSVQVGQSPEFERCMVYTMHKSPITAKPERWVAIEPQAGAANAFNSGEGLVLVEPGGQFAAEWSISVDVFNSSMEEQEL